MGMFDYVNHEVKCSCGTMIDEFQSKDGPCILATLEIEDVRNFYGFCSNCGNEYEYFQKNLKLTIKDYELVIRKKKNDK